MSYNRLTFLPLDIIEALETIKYINVSHNVLQILNFQITVVNTIDPADPGNNLNVYIYVGWILVTIRSPCRVEAWLLVLAQFCNGCAVDLSHNRITYFAEFFGEKFYDNVKPYNIILDLKGNNIRHITDMTKGLNFKQPAKFCCDDKNKFQQPFAITIYTDSLVCDCGDFTAKQYNVQYYFNLDLTQAICSAPTNLRNSSFAAISIDDMVCNVKDECPSNCKCFEQPSTNSTIINCTDAGLTDLPTTLPTLNRLPGFKYHLILSKNHINRLNHKEYINETTRLDISNSGVEEIDPRMWRALQTMSNVSLRNNLLTQFPEVPHGSFTGNQLDIQNNPISCNCKNKWLKSWLESIDKKILNSKGLNCNIPEWLKGKSVILLQEDDFCSDPPYTLKDVLLITIPTIGGLVLLSVIVILLLRTFRFKIFKYTKIHLFDRDECEGENMDYDVFLSRSSRDEEFAEELIALLEREEYTVCYPDRDFLPGCVINDNIVDSIYTCKRVLCLVANDFVQSNYCMDEFRISSSRDLEMGKKRTILLLKEPVQQFRDNENVPNVLRDYIRRHTCLVKENADWKNQLMYAMPVNRMPIMDETRFDGDVDLADGEPSFEITLTGGDNQINRQALFNFELL